MDINSFLAVEALLAKAHKMLPELFESEKERINASGTRDGFLASAYIVTKELGIAQAEFQLLNEGIKRFYIAPHFLVESARTMNPLARHPKYQRKRAERLTYKMARMLVIELEKQMFKSEIIYDPKIKHGITQIRVPQEFILKDIIKKH